MESIRLRGKVRFLFIGSWTVGPEDEAPQGVSERQDLEELEEVEALTP